MHLSTSGLTPSLDFLRCGRDRRSRERGFAVVLAEVAVDRGLEIDRRVEGAALQAATGGRGEEGLDRTGQEQEVGVREMASAGAGASQARTPAFARAGCCGASGRRSCRGSRGSACRRHGGLAVARHALADHRAVEDIERRQQGGGAVPDVIVGHRSGATLLHRQAWVGAVERLNLRLLVDRKHQAVGRQVEIQLDDIAQFGGKSRILRQLEAPHPV